MARKQINKLDEELASAVEDNISFINRGIFCDRMIMDLAFLYKKGIEFGSDILKSLRNKIREEMNGGNLG